MAIKCQDGWPFVLILGIKVFGILVIEQPSVSHKESDGNMTRKVYECFNDFCIIYEAK